MTPDGAESFAAFAKTVIEQAHGPQLPCRREQETLRGFWDRFGDKAPLITEHAFREHGGMWKGAPVTARRFGKSNDPFFALPLLAELGT